MFRTLAKRLFSTTCNVGFSERKRLILLNQNLRQAYDNHAITVCSVIAYTSILSFFQRSESREQNQQILKEIQELKQIKNNDRE